jgi:opacity protein-like surface antigen
MSDSIRPLTRGLALAVATAAVVVAPAAAQAPDFLFGRPTGSVGVFGGWSMPREGSDLFDFVQYHLTVEEGDFSGPLLGAEVALGLTDFLDVVLGIERSWTERRSEDFHWEEPVDWSPDPLPIEQTTEFAVTRLTASGRIYLLPRGMAVGSHAWLPARWSPYVGGGGGIAWYRFEQFGDFVNYETIDHPDFPDGPEIFTDRFRSTGSGGTLHAIAGLEVSLTRQLVLRGEYRYNWGDAPVDSRAFSGFEPIDLAGHRATIGIATRF